MIIHATNKDVIIKESERLISGSVKIYTCEFTFDESWDGYVKTVVFSTGGSRLVNVALLDNVCEIPPEVLRPNARVRIGIYGTDGVRSRPTTYSEWINVEQGADMSGNYAEPPTPSVYDQWVAGLDAKHEEWNANEQARVEAENARVEAEQAREDKETGYVAQAKAYAESAQASKEASASSQTVAEAAKASAENSAIGAAQNAAIAQNSASNALNYSNEAAYSAAQAKISETNAKASDAIANTVAANAEIASNAAASASASAIAAANSATEAQGAATSAATEAAGKVVSDLQGYVSDAESAKAGAETAQRAAEKARDEASAIVGGDFATKIEAQGYANKAETNANTYTDQKIAAIPAPDVSGQIGAHNTATDAHADIRTLAGNAQTTADNHIANKNNPHGVTAAQVGADPAGSASAAQTAAATDATNKVNSHNTNTSAHSDIRTLVSNAQSKANSAASAAATAQNTANSKANADLSNVTAEALLAAIEAAGGGGAKIATGSYTGTGKYGSSNKNKLTFDFVPKFVIIQGSKYYSNITADCLQIGILTQGCTGAFTSEIYAYRSKLDTNGNELFGVTVSWSGNAVTWYAGANYQAQLNESGYTYGWIAIG